MPPHRSPPVVDVAPFVIGTPARRAVFLDLAAGETDLDRIVAKNRLLRPAAERAVQELEKVGVARKDGDAWRITDEGVRVRAQVQKRFF